MNLNRANSEIKAVFRANAHAFTAVRAFSGSVHTDFRRFLEVNHLRFGADFDAVAAAGARIIVKLDFGQTDLSPQCPEGA